MTGQASDSLVWGVQVFKFVQGMKRASSMAGEGLQGDPLDKDDDASDSGDLSEEDGEGGAGRGEVKARGDSGSKKINVKVKATADRSSGDADGGRVYSWADVLAAVRGQRDQAVKVKWHAKTRKPCVW